MSKVTNKFLEGSETKIKCTHSTDDESYLIRPEQLKDNLEVVGGSDKYLILQAIKSNGELEPSKIYSILCDSNYEPRTFYVEEYCIWVIWAERRSGIGIEQTNVNVEIGPIHP